ncbi:hypothetical protein F5B21DRAFT_505625 [Xylaria acuta]|nr:hypothetical protein F5B21DRAFT_505625 [Xylaria acuta]
MPSHMLFHGPELPSSHATLNIKEILALKDEKIQSEFHALAVSDIDMPKHSMVNKWTTYLEINGCSSAFMPLEGTERSRYNLAFRKAADEETNRKRIALDTLQRSIAVGKLLIRRSEIPKYPIFRRPATIEDLHEVIGRAPRHTRQRPEFHKAVYKTEYGLLTACTILPVDWYIGHQSGDPIIRVESHPIPGYFNEEDMFFHRELAGLEDGDEADRYEVHFEGVVPFNKAEMYQRFTENAFPTFLEMVIAVIGFHPSSMERGTHPWVVTLARILTLRFEDVLEEDRSRTLKLLETLWKVKYGDETNNHPEFLRDQVNTSISAFREMGWLMSQLEANGDRIKNRHYWTHCKKLVQIVTGHGIEALAKQHHDIQLAGEAKTLLRAGQVGDILIYTQSNKTPCKIHEQYQDYDNDNDDEAAFQRILELRQASNFPSYLGPQQQQQPAPPPARPAKRQRTSTSAPYRYRGDSTAQDLGAIPQQ